MHLRAIPDTVARPAAGLARAIARGGKGVLALAVATVLLVVAVQPILAQPVYTGATSDASAGGTGLLDGLAFTGPTGTAGMDADHQERVVFENGQFRSLACEEWGFAPGTYRAVRDGDAVRFGAANVSARYGTMRWQGVVRDGRIEARYTWVKGRGLWTLRRDYWFQGRLGGEAP